MIACLQKDIFLTGEENCSLCGIVGVVILAHLRWGMLRVWLGVYHTLMWDRILQHGGRGCCAYCCCACGGTGYAEEGGRLPESFNLLKSAIWGQW
jgi:hypothetical protein